MAQEVHMGDIVREILTSRKLKHSAVAKEAGMTTANFGDMLTRATIGPEILMRVGASMGVDLVGLIKHRMEGYANPGPDPEFSEPAPAAFQRKSAAVVTVELDQFDEVTQLKLLKYIQQLPRKKP